MAYESYTAESFFTKITTEADARALLWCSCVQGKEFHCPIVTPSSFFLPFALGPQSVPAEAADVNFAAEWAPSLKARRPPCSSG